MAGGLFQFSKCRFFDNTGTRSHSRSEQSYGYFFEEHTPTASPARRQPGSCSANNTSTIAQGRWQADKGVDRFPGL
jgi:hypothetical protein